MNNNCGTCRFNLVKNTYKTGTPCCTCSNFSNHSKLKKGKITMEDQKLNEETIHNCFKLLKDFFNKVNYNPKETEGYVLDYKLEFYLKELEKHLDINKKPEHREFYDIIDQMVSTFEKKNHDYAGSDAKDMMKNFMECEDYGIKMSSGIITRMSDKITRMKNLMRTRTKKVKDESLIDTVQDLANYCILLIIALKRENNDV